MPRTPKPSSSSSATITATSRQTRFSHQLTTSTTKSLLLPSLTIAIGQRTLLANTDLHLLAGTHYVLSGRNGIGKSTLLKVLGEKLVGGIEEGLRVLYMPQHELPPVNENVTPWEYVVRADVAAEQGRREVHVLKPALEEGGVEGIVRAVRKVRYERRLGELEEKRKEATVRSGVRGVRARRELKGLEVQVEDEGHKVDAVDANAEEVGQEVNDAAAMLADLEGALETLSISTAEIRARKLLVSLGLPRTHHDAPLNSLSSGLFQRTHLASLLFQQTDVLLLDEPTNYLDLPAIIFLEQHLSTHPAALLLITHDLAFADAIATKSLIFRDETLELFNGNISSYLRTRAEQQRRLTRMQAAQDKQKAHMEQSIQGNIRSAKSSGDDKKLKQAVSRQRKLDERMGMEVSATGGRFKLNRDHGGFHNSLRAGIEVPQDDPRVRFSFPLQPARLRFSGTLVALQGVHYRYAGAKEDVLRGVDLTIHPGSRTGVVGLNGAGKSTLVSLITSDLPGDKKSGSITHHPKLKVGIYSQTSFTTLETLPTEEPEMTALRYIQRLHPQLSEQEARGLLSGLGLPGRTASDVPVRALSGGQKVRVALANIFAVPPHLLVLDEVTTHLDADTIVVFAQELRRFEGAVLVVSHDRFFIRAVVEGEGMDGVVDEDGEADGGEAGVVYLMRKGGLKKLEDGVEGYERILMRKLDKATGG